MAWNISGSGSPTLAADGVAVKIQCDHSLGALFAEGWVVAALHNAEHFLALGARLLAAFTGPADGAFDGMAPIAWRGVVGRAFVKDHGDVRAEDALDGHALLGAQKQR